MVWQWSFKRYRPDIQAINAMVERAEAVAAGKRTLKKDRFVKVTDADASVDWDVVERAQQLAGLKGYVTNIKVDIINGERVVAAYAMRLVCTSRGWAGNYMVSGMRSGVSRTLKGGWW